MLKKLWNFLVTAIMLGYAVMMGTIAVDAVTTSNWYTAIKERRNKRNSKYSTVEKVEEDED